MSKCFCLNTLYIFNSIYFSNMHQHWLAVLACIKHCWSSNRCTIQCLPPRVLFQMDIKTKRSWLKYVIFLFLCDHSLSLSFSLFLFEHERGREDREKQPVGLVEWVSSFRNSNLSHCTMCLLCVCVHTCVCVSSVFLHVHVLVCSCYTIVLVSKIRIGSKHPKKRLCKKKI